MQPLTRFFASCASFIALSAFSASAFAADAPQYFGSAARGGTGAGESVRLNGPADLSLRYEQNVTSGKVYADPVIADGAMIVVSNAGEIVCLSLESGASRWSANLGEPIMSTPAIHAGRVFVGTTAGRVACLDLTTGERLWEQFHGGIQYAAMTIADGKVLVAPGFGNSNLIAYSALDGSIVWQREMSRDLQSPPAVAQGKVVVTTPDGKINAFNLSDGSLAWPASVQTTGIFYVSAPTLMRHPTSGTWYAYTSPGGETRVVGSTIAGYKGYVTYQISLDNGQAYQIVPGISGAPVAASKSKDGSLVTEATTQVTGAPHELQQQLNGLSHLDSILEVISRYESENQVDLTSVKEFYTREDQRARDAQAFMERKRNGNGTAASSGEDFSLPVSNLDPAWPSALQSRPGHAAYLERGANRFLAVMMREVPSTTVSPRTMLFSMDATTSGQTHWYYAAEDLEMPSIPYSQGAALFGRHGDPDGAYLLAPLGRCIAVFDAAASNTPLFQITMPNTTFATPVLSNGNLVLIDTGGHLKVFAGNNAAPSAPVIVSPASGSDMLDDATASWLAPQDDADAPAAISYQLLYRVNGILEPTRVDVPAGITSYQFAGLPADADVSFMVRAIDTNGALSVPSAEQRFTWQRDRTAPLAPTGLQVSGGSLRLDLAFTPSTSTDVTGYRVRVSAQGTQQSFTVNTGVVSSLVINGANPQTPLTAGTTYLVQVSALDRRGNASPEASAAGTVTAPTLEDTLPPVLLSALLRDSNRDGRIETVVLTFNENINTTNINAAGFMLGSTPALGHAGASGRNLTLNFGLGATGTGLLDLTYDSAMGLVTDLSGNTLASVDASAAIEVDSAAPILLRDTLVTIDDNGDGTPDRIRGDFSEALAPGSLTLAMVGSVRDSNGLELTVTGLAILANGYTMELQLDGSRGTLGRPSLALQQASGSFFTDTTGNAGRADSSNLPPAVEVALANALDQRIMAPGIVVFDASATIDPDGNDAAMTFTWRVDTFYSSQAPLFFPAQDSVVSGTGLRTVRLIATETGTYGVRLSVTDEAGQIAEKLVTFTVRNEAPRVRVVSPVDAYIFAGNVDLDASESSDLNSSASADDIVTREWTLVSAPANAGLDLESDDAPLLILGSDEAQATFLSEGLVPGTYVLRHTVTDAAGLTSSADVEVRLYDSGNLAPVANAGPDLRVALGQPIRLDGRFSSDDSQITFLWESITDGVDLRDAATSLATAHVTRVGTYGFRLKVSDHLFSDSDTVWVTVFDPNGEDMPSLAISAPQVVTVGESFTIDATATASRTGSGLGINLVQTDGPAIAMWRMDGSALLFEGVALVPGRVRLTAQAITTTGASRAQELEIIVQSAANRAPTAIVSTLAGAANLEDMVTLAVNQSIDPENAELSYSVRQLSGPRVLALSIDDDGMEFRARVAGEYVFDVRVNDGENTSPAQIVRVPVALPGIPLPRAVAGASTQVVNVGNSREFSLTANGVAVAGGRTAGFRWVQTAGPSAEVMTPDRATSVVRLPEVNATYSFALLVDDGEIQASAGTVDVIGTNAPVSAVDTSPISDGGGCSAAGRSALPIGLGALMLLALVGMGVARRRREAGVESTTNA